ncbi:MAG: Spy/CpxP family protein refolding chaperone [Candidatus Eiseniibacteriota bacterium]
MSRNLRVAFALLALGFAALPAGAQAGDRGHSGMKGAEGAAAGDRETRRPRGLITRLIEHRSDLGLSDDQVSRLEQLKTSHEAQNRPLGEQLQRAHDEFRREVGGPDRAAMRNLPPDERKKVREERMKQRKEYMAKHLELTPVVDQLKANRKAQREEVMSVLTPDQQKKLKDTIEKRKAEWRSKGGRDGAPRRSS